MTTSNKKKPLLFRLIEWLSEISGYLSGIAILAAAFVVFYQVAARYFLKLPTIWQTELTIYLLMFATFVGGAYGLKHNAHVGVEIVLEKISPRAQSILKIVTSILAVILTIIVAWKGFEMWWEATEKGWRSDSLWGPPLMYPYFILPLGMLLISLQYIVLIYEEFLALGRDNQ